MNPVSLLLLTILFKEMTVVLGSYSFVELPDLMMSRKELTTVNMMVEEVSSEGLWENLYQRTPPPRRDPPAGSRGDKDVCIVAPAMPGKIEVVWSDRPLFLWQGSIGKLEVRPRNRERILWSYSIREAQNSAIYDGEALQPGQTYDLVVFNQRSIQILRATFQVAKKQEIEGIRSDLSQLEAQMKQEGATEERIAYAKANYFAVRGMWGDVLQVAYGVEEPSDSLNKFIEKVVEQLCLLD